MQKVRHDENPLKVFGVPFFEKTKALERLPEDLREKLPNLEFLGRRCPGARLCFRTDSEKIIVRASLKTLSLDVALSLYDCQSLNVMAGKRSEARFLGIVNPPDYNTKTFEKQFVKGKGMEDVTIFFPRNEVLDFIEVEFEDGAKIEAPTPYKYEKPILYYGSSITEGGCSARTTNVYSAIISNHLDVDFYNMGFSGNAKGEIEMADYINSIEMSIFVLDYDHNAPSAEHLENTHEAFFKRIREKNPTLPVVIMSCPDFDYYEDAKKRREIIKKTYENAKKSGDENVYFIDGESFFGKKDRHLCTNDCIHPNDLGFYRMAEVIEPLIKEILEKEKPDYV